MAAVAAGGLRRADPVGGQGGHRSGPLTRAEAVAWLARAEAAGADHITAAGATLAQLYALRGGDPVGSADAPTGLYL